MMDNINPQNMGKSEKKKMAALARVIKNPEVAEQLADMVDSSLDSAETLDSSSINLLTDTLSCFTR